MIISPILRRTGPECVMGLAFYLPLCCKQAEEVEEGDALGMEE